MRTENNIILNPSHICPFCGKKEIPIARIEHTQMVLYQTTTYICDKPSCVFYINTNILKNWKVIKPTEVLDRPSESDKVNSEDKSNRKLPRRRLLSKYEKTI
jgi:predicted RNA-binding Zn-ribbon protein involved in translation (DUF1610 family)